MKVYRIRDTRTGEFVGSGLRATKYPKTWDAYHLAMNALHRQKGYGRSINNMLERYKIVEFELREVIDK